MLIWPTAGVQAIRDRPEEDEEYSDDRKTHVPMTLREARELFVKGYHNFFFKTAGDDNRAICP